MKPGPEPRKRDPQRKIAKVEERVLTYLYWVTLECGHKERLTRSAKQRGNMPKTIGCFRCRDAEQAAAEQERSTHADDPHD